MCFVDRKSEIKLTLCSRLSEFAPAYFDLASFSDGEMKRALQRAADKKSRAYMLDGSDKSSKKKRQNDGMPQAKRPKFEA